MQQGESERFRPDSYVRQQHPAVRVLEMELPGDIQGCIDFEQRIIWLDSRLTVVQRRCTLTFEVGQLQQGPTPNDPCLAAARQRAAEDWAARMLIPTGCLMGAFRISYDLAVIAAYLEVDLPLLRARLRGMTDGEQDAAMAALQGLSATV